MVGEQIDKQMIYINYKGEVYKGRETAREREKVKQIREMEIE
jgi:hypothetical protein